LCSVIYEILEEAVLKMNDFGAKRIPFLFIIDYKFEKPIVIELQKVESENIFYKVNNQTNFPFSETPKRQIEITKAPISFQEYQKSFEIVQKHIKRGDSFLVNLTKPTPIALNMSLQEIFEYSEAKYQLYFKNQFVTFSPEIFVKITNNVISSHPMKGTISAEIPNAEKIILADKKELAEHTTIVDLIRNDLSMVAKKVWVERFRYIDRIKTHTIDLLQVSSKICGDMEINWQNKIGNILQKLLPAGSVTGAPKPETLKIIAEAENYNRGYYTGIFGIFDGENLDSGVMIRFIENTNDGFVFKSGGGITAQSKAAIEYQEMVDKIYIANKLQ
jgi:para-aminobenzoate synthetase component I